MPETSHPAVITKIKGSKLTLTLDRKTACADCHAKETCAILTCHKQTFEVNINKPHSYHIGQEVILSAPNKNLLFAVFLGYIAPLILVLSSLFITHYYTQNELFSSSISLGLLAFYYIILSISNRFIQNKITIKIG